MRKVNLYSHQAKAIEQLRTGSILCGGVGSGKSITAVAYYYTKILSRTLNSGSYIFAEGDPPLYIITTARKRDTKDWEQECEPFGLTPIVDSWNNIKKYITVKNAFFIFDEQRVIGYGAWVKAFLKITKQNDWILLSATPGDTWMDYIPVFIANGFYRNKRDFIDHHVIYSRFAKYPKVEKYFNTGRLMHYRRQIVVNMEYEKKTVRHDETVFVPFDRNLVKHIMVQRWNPYEDAPITEPGALCYVLRKAVNSDPGRIEALKDLLRTHQKAIIFYNYNYELDLLRAMAEGISIKSAEWNGHKHEPIPETQAWIYLVQYTAGAEGWNCVETDTIIFYSENYSYMVMTQAAGRIDRMNTPFTHLYYYHLCSRAYIDLAIRKALAQKRNFNEAMFAAKA